MLGVQYSWLPLWICILYAVVSVVPCEDHFGDFQGSLGHAISARKSQVQAQIQYELFMKANEEFAATFGPEFHYMDRHIRHHVPKKRAAPSESPMSEDEPRTVESLEAELQLIRRKIRGSTVYDEFVKSFTEDVQQATGSTDVSQYDDVIAHNAELRAVLELMYDENGGNFWLSSTNWLSKEPICTWSNLVCEEPYTPTKNISLKSISMRLNNVSGVLNPAMALLEDLTILRLGVNILTGTIPPVLLYGWRNTLTEISLSSNYFDGTIPSEFGLMDRLGLLLLNSNSISGSLPTEFSDMKNLTFVDFEMNVLSGSIPTEYCSSSTLQFLIFSNNGLTGIIPSCLGTMHGLKYLDLSENNLNGTMFSFYEGSELYYLGLGGNYLHGTVPDKFETSPFLSHLSLYGNALEGTLPTSVISAVNLTFLDLDSNSFEGEIPSEYGSINGLKSLYLYTNRLNGTIPSELGKLTEINEILLFQNRLEGQIPTELFDLHKMQVLILNRNNLVSTIPTEIGKLDQLRVVAMEYSGLYGTIPTEIGLCSGVGAILLTGNTLGGTIPSEIGQNARLAQLFLNQNVLTGTIPSTFSNLRVLQAIDLSQNGLYGDISELPFQNITTLNRLSLHSNQFGGNELRTELTLLSIIDLHQNNLDIQAIELFNFLSESSLVSFDISNNTVYGQIPMETATVAIAESYSVIHLGLANTSILTGEIPPKLMIARFPSLQSLDISGNPFVLGPLPLEWIRTSTALQTLVITGTKISGNNSDGLVFFKSERSLFPTYSCPKPDFQSPNPLFTIIGFTPAYFNYEGCVCNRDFDGVPPNCRFVGNRRSTALVVTISILAGIILTIGTLYIIRFGRSWYRLRQEVRRARDLLQQYPGLSRSKEMSLLASNTPSLIDSEWIIPFENIHMVQDIGHGATSRVTLGIWNHTNVAVKQFIQMMDVDPTEFRVEASVHCRLRHPNVVLLMGICEEPLCTVTEFMSNGSLFDIFKSGSEIVNTPGIRKRWALHIARGMNYLHSKNILHRDMKSLNVLVSDECVAKVCDFGHSRLDSSKTMTQGVGTIPWMAPETFLSAAYTQKSDVYAFGIVLTELATGHPPYEGLISPMQIRDAVIAGTRPEVPARCAPWYSALVAHCVMAEPQNRPDFEEIVSVLESADTADVWVDS